MTLFQKALKGIIWTFLDKILNQMCSFIILIYIAREIGPDSFGLVGLLTIFLLIGDTVVNSGFLQALVQKSKNVKEIDYNTIFIVNLGLAILVYTILFFTSPLIASFYSEPELTKLARVVFIIVIINSLSIICRAKLTIDVNFRYLALANTIASLFSLAVGVLLVNLGYSYWSLIILNVVKSLVNTLCLFYLTKWVPKLQFSIESFISLFRFGFNLLVAGILSILSNNLYSIVIGRYYSTTQVGYYSQATNLTNAISTTITTILQKVTYPILTSINDDRDRLNEVYITLIKVTALISLPSMVGFAIISRDFTHVFLGDEWLPVIPVLFYLSLARLFTPISAVNMNILNAIGRSDLFLFVDLIKIPIFLIGIYIAHPFGIEAIAQSVFITTTFSFFINAYYPGKILGFGALKQIKSTCKIIASTLIMYIASKLYNIDDNLMNLIFNLVCLPIVYISSLFLLKEKTLSNIINRLRTR